MAIAYRAAGTVAAGTGTSVTPGLPTGWQAGDVLIALLTIRATDAAPSVPGWTLRADGSNASPVRCAVYTRVAVDGDTGPAFSWSTSAGYLAQVVAYSGCDQTTPMDATATYSAVTLSANGTAPTITTVTANAMHVVILQKRSGFGGCTPPGGYAERVDVPGNPMHSLADLAYASPGATGAGVFTNVNVADWMATSLALRPEATGHPARARVQGIPYHAARLTPGRR